MSKIEASESFKCSEGFKNRLHKDCANLDVTKSDFIRAAIELTRTTLIDHPWLVHDLNRNKGRIKTQ